MIKTTIHACKQCKRLFSGRAAARLCRDCSGIEEENLNSIESAVYVHEKKTAEEIAEFTKLELRTVNQLIAANPALGHQVEDEDLCDKCGALKGNAPGCLCAACFVAMNHDLDVTKAALNDTIKNRNARPEARLRRTSVREGIEEKRQRTASDSISAARRPVRGR